jgi:hypothetical protein
MSRDRQIVSRHFFRRTARAREHKLEARRRTMNSPGKDRFFYTVVKAKRGPYRWYVVLEER